MRKVAHGNYNQNSIFIYAIITDKIFDKFIKVFGFISDMKRVSLG